MRAVVDHVIDLSSPASTGTGPAPRELSALAWDPLANELVAASDRGRLFRFRLTVKDGRLHADAVLTRRLAVGDKIGFRMSAPLNPEALAWRSLPAELATPATSRAGSPGAPHPIQRTPPGPPEARGELLLADEQGDRVWRLAPDGRAIGDLEWPAAVRAALSAGVDDGTRHGVEAIAWHTGHGLLAALQRPIKATAGVDRKGAARTRVHWIHASSGSRWGFVQAGPESHLKAIEARPDGTLLLLERVRQPGDSRLHTILRWLDPAGCGDAALCAAPRLQVEPAPIVSDENVEGLACSADGTCWLVNDGGAEGEQPTRLWQFRLVPR